MLFLVLHYRLTNNTSHAIGLQQLNHSSEVQGRTYLAGNMRSVYVLDACKLFGACYMIMMV